MLRTLLDDLQAALGGRSEPRPERVALADWLPWFAWIPDRQIFANREGMGFCLELRPQSGADEEMAAILGSLPLAAPTGTGIQFHLYASPDLRGPLARYARLREPDDQLPEFHSRGREGRHTNIHRILARRRVGHFLDGAKRPLIPTQATLLRHFRLVMSVSLPGHAEDLSRLEELVQLRSAMLATLQAAGFPGRVWDADDLIAWVSRLLDPHRQTGDGPPLAYDDGRELRDQVMDPATRTRIEREGMHLSNTAHSGEADLRLLSVRAYPARYALWQMGSLIGDLYQGSLQLGCPFLITLNIAVLDPEATRSWAYLKAARATTNATSTMARFLPDLQDRRADWGIVLNALDDGANLVDLQHQVLLWCPPGEAVAHEQAARAVFRARGFELTRDALMHAQALVASLPMTLSRGFHADLKRMKRVSTKTSANAVHLAPVVAEWSGTGTPVLLLTGRRGQLMALDLYDNPAGNYNAAIAGTSGSGKSALLNEIALAYLGTGARVWIIDVGRSYEKACRHVGGSFIAFSEDTRFSLNPFAQVEDIDEEMELLAPLLAQMVSPREPLSAFQHATLAAAILAVWKELGPAMTVTDIHRRLASGRLDPNEPEEDRRLKDLASMLQPFTEDGPHGRWFTRGGEPVDFSAPFIVLELEELKAKKDLQSVVLLIVMYRITREMYFSREQPKIVIIDEAWDLLAGGACAEFIEAGYRRARKYRGAFLSATQSVEDYGRSPAAQAALANSDWLLLLRQKPEAIERLDRLGQLNLDDGLKRLLLSLRTEQGMYSEVFIHSPAGSGVGRLLLDPFSLLLYSSRAEDFQAIEAQRARGLDIGEAIDAVLEQRTRQL